MLNEIASRKERQRAKQVLRRAGATEVGAKRWLRELSGVYERLNWKTEDDETVLPPLPELLRIVERMGSESADTLEDNFDTLRLVPENQCQKVCSAQTFESRLEKKMQRSNFFNGEAATDTRSMRLYKRERNAVADVIIGTFRVIKTLVMGTIGLILGTIFTIIFLAVATFGLLVEFGIVLPVTCLVGCCVCSTYACFACCDLMTCPCTCWYAKGIYLSASIEIQKTWYNAFISSAYPC